MSKDVRQRIRKAQSAVASWLGEAGGRQASNSSYTTLSSSSNGSEHKALPATRLYKRRIDQQERRQLPRVSAPQLVKRTVHVSFDCLTQSFQGVPDKWREEFHSRLSLGETATVGQGKICGGGNGSTNDLKQHQLAADKDERRPTSASMASPSMIRSQSVRSPPMASQPARSPSMTSQLGRPPSMTSQPGRPPMMTSQSTTSQPGRSPTITSQPMTSQSMTSQSMTSQSMTSQSMKSQSMASQSWKSPAMTSQSMTSSRQLAPTQDVWFDRSSRSFVNLPAHWHARLERNNLLDWPEFQRNPRLLALVFGMMDEELRQMDLASMGLDASEYGEDCSGNKPAAATETPTAAAAGTDGADGVAPGRRTRPAVVWRQQRSFARDSDSDSEEFTEM